MLHDKRFIHSSPKLRKKDHEDWKQNIDRISKIEQLL